MSALGSELLPLVPAAVAGTLAAIVFAVCRREWPLALRSGRRQFTLLALLTLVLVPLTDVVVSDNRVHHGTLRVGIPDTQLERDAALRAELDELFRSGMPSRRLQRLAYEAGKEGAQSVERLLARAADNPDRLIRLREIGNALVDGLGVAVGEGRLTEEAMATLALRLEPHQLRLQKRLREGDQLIAWIAELPAGLSARLEEWPDYPHPYRNRHHWRAEVLSAAVISTIRQECRLTSLKPNTASIEVPLTQGAYVAEVTWKSELRLGKAIIAERTHVDRQPLQIIPSYQPDSELELASIANPFVDARMEVALIECGEGWALHARIASRPRIREALAIGEFTISFENERHTLQLGSSDAFTTRASWEEGWLINLGRISPLSETDQPTVELIFESINDSRFTSPIKEVGWPRRTVIARATASVLPLNQRWWLRSETDPELVP